MGFKLYQFLLRAVLAVACMFFITLSVSCCLSFITNSLFWSVQWKLIFALNIGNYLSPSLSSVTTHFSLFRVTVLVLLHFSSTEISGAFLYVHSLPIATLDMGFKPS
jgi:hypothetical protein